MADAEMVIKGMEKIYESYVDSEIVERHDYGDTRTADIFKQNASIIHDALELLKAQEPVKPVRTTQHAQGADEVWFECGKCYAFLGINWGVIKACPQCGKPVKWE